MAVLIDIPENPNCSEWAGQVFQPRTAPRPVSHVRRERDREERWCEITGLEENAALAPAMACLIDDSGEGACYLVFGGAWGLRLQESKAMAPAPWDIADSSQWGEPFLLLGADGADLRFQ